MLDYARQFFNVPAKDLDSLAASIDIIVVDIDRVTKDNEHITAEFVKRGMTYDRMNSHVESKHIKIIEHNTIIYTREDEGLISKDPVFSFFNTRGGKRNGNSYPAIIPAAEFDFLAHVFYEIKKYRNNVGKMRASQVLGGWMWAHEYRGWFDKGKKYGRYALSGRWRNKLPEVREEKQAMCLEWEKTIAHLLSTYGEMLFPHVWEALLVQQKKMGGLATLGEGVELGIAGNVTVTHNFDNKGHTDEDETPAWGVWTVPDVTGRRTPDQVDEAILHHSYFLLPTFGYAVKLVHGAALAWHSGEIIHGTTKAVWKNVPSAKDFVIIGSSIQWTKRLVARVASVLEEKEIDIEGPPEIDAMPVMRNVYKAILDLSLDSDDETLQDRADRFAAEVQAKIGKEKGKVEGGVKPVTKKGRE